MSVLPPDPDALAGAQERLVQALGVDAVFILPPLVTWPPDTELDPETGKPYDPFLEPETSTPGAEITVRCSFVHRPLDAADPAASPIGAIDRGTAALILTPTRHQGVLTAKRVRVGEETWDIQQFRHDVALGVPRWVAYLEHA